MLPSIPTPAKRWRHFPDATDAEVSRAIAAAHEAFLAWRETSFSERGGILQKAADILRRDSDRYARLLTLEMGKLTAEAKAEVELSAKILEYYVRNAETLLQPEKLPVLDAAEGEAVLLHEPLGVLLAIEPWNFPYYQVARILAPQLSAGNTLLLKHASNVPQSAAAFEALLREAGLPEGAFRNLYATRAQLELIINDLRVHGVALTGSEGAGSVVAAQAGKALKKVDNGAWRFRCLHRAGRCRPRKDGGLGGVRTPLERRTGLLLVKAHDPRRSGL
jgi:succinate-semialdehyde dehydrogenase/glutarate-semialdehyde dehydrogenase